MGSTLSTASFGAAVEFSSDLIKRFPDVLAVDRLSVEVKAGEIFGLVGPDGAGKTTALRMLAGVLTPDSGSAMIAGFDIVRDPEAAKAVISYMPQRFGLYEDLTVDENIRFYADIFGVSRTERVPRANQLLTAANLVLRSSRSHYGVGICILPEAEAAANSSPAQEREQANCWA